MIWEALRHLGPVASVANSTIAAWVVRAGFASTALWAGYGLVGDVATLS